MPCMCWYEPSDEVKQRVKNLCKELVGVVRLANQIGDPIGLSIEDVHELLDHLYDPQICKEKNDKSIPKT